MIVIKLELHSARTGKVTEIGRAIIANVGGTTKYGDYTCKVGRQKADGDEYTNKEVWSKPLREGEVVRYPRLSYNVWRLVIRGLRDAFPEEG